MNSNIALTLFLVIVSGLIWAGTSNNDPNWTGNKNQCVGECYEAWKEAHDGGIAATEQAKQAALAAASPEALEKPTTGSVWPAMVLTVRAALAHNCRDSQQRTSP